MEPIKKRITIIGVPGSGKSTLALKLGQALDIPTHHLDSHVFTSDGKKKSKEEILAIQENMMEKSSWIIEGCAISTLEKRFSEADIVLYFHFSRLLCLWRIFKRWIHFDKDLSKTGCIRKANWTLIKYIWTFKKEKGPIIVALKKKYPQVEFCMLKKTKDIHHYLTNVKK